MSGTDDTNRTAGVEIEWVNAEIDAGGGGTMKGRVRLPGTRWESLGGGRHRVTFHREAEVVREPHQSRAHWVDYPAATGMTFENCSAAWANIPPGHFVEVPHDFFGPGPGSTWIFPRFFGPGPGSTWIFPHDPNMPTMYGPGVRRP